MLRHHRSYLPDCVYKIMEKKLHLSAHYIIKGAMQLFIQIYQSVHKFVIGVVKYLYICILHIIHYSIQYSHAIEPMNIHK